MEISDADYEEDFGYLKWETKLGQTENKKYRISYEIKYGKSVRVMN